MTAVVVTRTNARGAGTFIPYHENPGNAGLIVDKNNKGGTSQ